MLCNTMSIYPNGIDPMMFFQDNDIEKIEIINEYNKLISQGKYDEANTYINQQEGIYGYFADFFNALENRIYALQEYLLNKPPKYQPFNYYDGDEFPIGEHYVLEDYSHEELEEYTQEELECATNIDVNGNLGDLRSLYNKDVIWI